MTVQSGVFPPLYRFPSWLFQSPLLWASCCLRPVTDKLTNQGVAFGVEATNSATDAKLDRGETIHPCFEVTDVWTFIEQCSVKPVFMDKNLMLHVVVHILIPMFSITLLLAFQVYQAFQPNTEQRGCNWLYSHLRHRHLMGLGWSRSAASPLQLHLSG